MRKLIVVAYLIFFIIQLIFEEVEAKNLSKQLLAPEQLTSEFRQQFSPLGQAKFSFLFWDIYRSQLFSTTGAFSYEHSTKLLFEISYLRDISQQELIDNTKEQWRHIGLADESIGAYLPMLATIWPDIKKGDVLALLVNGYTSSFYFNNYKIGTVADKEFGKDFLDIWLSENTSQLKLRKQLLARSNDE